MAVAPREAMMSGFVSVDGKGGRRWKSKVVRARPVKVPRRARRVVSRVGGRGCGCGRWPRRWARGGGRRWSRGGGRKGLRWWSMSKGRGGESEGGGEGRRVVFDAVELAAEVVDGGGDMLGVSMVRALMTFAGMVV